jgi:transposase-like protein
MSSKSVSKKTKSVGKSTKRGVRYSSELKAEVVNFVKAHNARKGRGGQSAAARKFGVTILTVSAWLKGSASGKQAKGKAAAASAGLRSGISALLKIGSQLSKLEAKASKLRAKQQALIAALK